VVGESFLEEFLFPALCVNVLSPLDGCAQYRLVWRADLEDILNQREELDKPLIESR